MFFDDDVVKVWRLDSIYLFIYWARIKKDIHDRWCEKEMRDQCNVERVYVLLDETEKENFTSVNKNS